MSRDSDAGRRIVDPDAPAAGAWRAAVRQVQARHGLQARALEAHTERCLRQGEVPRSYSKTSWQRVLSGEVLPPEWAVRMLCAWKGEAPEPLVALLRQATAEPAPPPAVEPRPVASRRRWPLALAAFAAGLVVALAAFAATGVFGGSRPPGSGIARADAPTGPAACRGADCRNRDADATGCRADGVTLAQREVGAARLQLRYSRACAAAWASITAGVNGTVLTVLDPASGAAATRPVRSAGNVRTAMIETGAGPLRACVTLDAAETCVGATP